MRPGRGEFRACADDLAAVLREGGDVGIMRDHVYAVEQGACLKLKGKKCVAVPLWCTYSLHAAEVLRDLFGKAAPDWYDFQIKAVAKYFGPLVRPCCD